MEGLFVVVVFDFRFCQSRFTGGTPVNGFHPFIDIAFFEYGAENADLHGFIVGF